MDESLPAIALMNTEAPGTDVNALTEQLRNSLQQHSGRLVVTTAQVDAELGACTVAPCVDVVSRRFQGAAFVARASLSRVGDVYLVTIEILEDGISVVRHGAQAKDIPGALEEAGRQAGAALYLHSNP
jgi:hypothetical protein